VSHTELPNLHARSFAKPFERIESLCPPLHFRVLLGSESTHKLEVVSDHYNQHRPHGALGYLTPAEFAAIEALSVHSCVPTEELEKLEAVPRLSSWTGTENGVQGSYPRSHGTPRIVRAVVQSPSSRTLSRGFLLSQKRQNDPQQDGP
jgi:hypothetical protein